MAKKKRTTTRQPGKLMAMDMATEIERELVGTAEAAEILGCTMGRVRQMCRQPEGGGEPQLWSSKFNNRALVLDLEQVKRLAKARQKARDAGISPGPAPGGFQPDT